MLRTRNLILNGTPQELTVDDSIDTPNTISIQNLDENEYLYLGDAAVSYVSYGIRLSPGQMWSADLESNDKIFSVGSGPVAILILER